MATPEATRNLITSHTRAQAAKAACDVFIAKILTSGLKPHTRSKILERGLTNPLEISRAAANIELLDNEKKPKSIAPIQSEEEIDAVKYGQNRCTPNIKTIKLKVVIMGTEVMVAINKLKTGKHKKNGNQQQQQNGKKKKPTHFKKYGHPIEKFFFKYPHLRKKGQ